MSDFQNAVELVHGAVQGWRENGVELRASAASLERLAEVATSAPGLTAGSAGASQPASVPVPKVEGRPEVRSAPTEVSSVATVSSVPIERATVSVESRSAARSEIQEGSMAERLAKIRGPILACTKCPHLVRSRTQVVFGVGNPEAELMFVGEAPGEDEDRQGEPFVGRAGELLTKIIVAMNFRREDVYIANVLKCRPDMPAGAPGNRKPRADEMQTCLPYLREQIEIIRPRVIVALGATAMLGLTGDTSAMAKLRGRWHEFDGIPLMATYHPAYLLRNQSLTEKRKVWEDMLLVLERLEKPISAKQRGFFLAKS